LVFVPCQFLVLFVVVTPLLLLLFLLLVSLLQIVLGVFGVLLTLNVFIFKCFRNVLKWQLV
jgi:hypothetical protein